jgi:membrane protein
VIGGLRAAFAGFFANQGFFLAGGLSFFFLICIIPLLFLTVSVTGFILSRDTAAQVVVAQVAQYFPVYRVEVTRALLRIVETRTISGLVGTGILILFSTQLFTSVRLVLNRFLGGRRGGYFRGMLFDIVLVFAIGLLFLANLLVSDIFTWVKLLVMEPARVPPRWLQNITLGFALALSTAMFYMVYRFLPNRRVAVVNATVAALAASVLWEVAKQLFRLYIRKLGLYDQIYGPLGVLVAFIMFVYYTMIVFVLGAAYLGALETRRK